MIKVNNKVLCEHCFAQTGREPCPECGFDSNTYICDPMTLRAGSILAGRYAIGRVIGKGGFGVTYLAYDLKLECRVAVKEYYPYGLAVRFPGSTQVSVTAAQAEETFKAGADKFYDEARLVAQFNGNPNIVSVYDFFYENDTVYFTMGYLDGQTLKDYLKEHGALTSGQAVYVADAVSNALTAAHSRNVLHRDISPDNIMVCRDGSIKLLDFGAARQVLTEGSQSLSVILKQGFAPLEQYQKKGKQGPWTDIYSLGATLYHALTLDTLDDPMSRLEGDEEYHSNVHGIEEGLWRIIKKATMLKSADRYQDVFELRKGLGSLSIEPVPLVDMGETDGKIQYGTTARVFGGTMRSVSVGIPDSTTVNSEPVQEEDVGVTQPLREEAVRATQPLQEEDVGVTQPLREEDGKMETAARSQKWYRRNVDLWIVMISGAIQMMLFAIGGGGLDWWLEIWTAAVGGVTFALLCLYYIVGIGKKCNNEGSPKVEKVWICIWSCILIAAGVVVIITYRRIYVGDTTTQDAITSGMPFALMEEMILCGGVYTALKRNKKNLMLCRKNKFILRCVSIAMYYCFLVEQDLFFWYHIGLIGIIPYIIYFMEVIMLVIILVLYTRGSRICAVWACLGGTGMPAIQTIIIFREPVPYFGFYRHDSDLQKCLLIYVVLSVIAIILTFYGHWHRKDIKSH